MAGSQKLETLKEQTIKEEGSIERIGPWQEAWRRLKKIRLLWQEVPSFAR